MINTADSLLESVRRACTAPDYQARIESSDILSMADEIIMATIIPLIINANAELLVRREVISVVSGQREYSIPARAIGRVLRNVFYRTSSTSELQKLQQFSYEDECDYSGTTGTPRGIIFEGDSFIPLPQATSGEFVVSYACQPSALVTLSESGRIASIDRTTGVVALESALGGLTTNTPCDFVAGTQSYNLKGLDATPLDVSSTNVQFSTSDIPSTLAIGDYLCLAGETPVIPLPRELNTLLTIGTQVQVFQLLGDLESASAAQSKFVELYKTIPSILTPRLVGTPKKVSPSPFYASSTRRAGWLNNP